MATKKTVPTLEKATKPAKKTATLPKAPKAVKEKKEPAKRGRKPKAPAHTFTQDQMVNATVEMLGSGKMVNQVLKKRYGVKRVKVNPDQTIEFGKKTKTDNAEAQKNLSKAFPTNTVTVKDGSISIKLKRPVINLNPDTLKPAITAILEKETVLPTHVTKAMNRKGNLKPLAKYVIEKLGSTIKEAITVTEADVTFLKKFRKEANKLTRTKKEKKAKTSNKVPRPNLKKDLEANIAPIAPTAE